MGLTCNVRCSGVEIAKIKTSQAEAVCPRGRNELEGQPCGAALLVR